MSDSPNPYRPPAIEHHELTWWEKLWYWLGPASKERSPKFTEGEAEIYEGVSYFVDPDNNAVAYAACPSVDRSDKRMRLIVSEALRLLPGFLEDFPEFRPLIQDRRLCVRMIAAYTDKQAEYQRESDLEWEEVRAVLERNEI